MTLYQLTTPDEKKRIIMYANDGNTVVRRSKNCKKVFGDIWRGEIFRNPNCNYDSCELYLYNENARIGIHVATVNACSEPWELKSRQFPSTKEAVEKSIQYMIEHNMFINLTIIEYLKQAAPDMVDGALQSRGKFLEAKREREEQREKEELARREQEEREEAKLKAMEDERKRKEYKGFLDGKSKMQSGRIVSVLDKNTRVDGKTMSRREFVERKLKEGWIPNADTIENDVDEFDRKWNIKSGKSKTEYMLRKGNLGYIILKMQYDYATYLYSMNLF